MFLPGHFSGGIRHGHCEQALRDGFWDGLGVKSFSNCQLKKDFDLFDFRPTEEPTISIANIIIIFLLTVSTPRK